jgi:hypothetical protein
MVVYLIAGALRASKIASAILSNSQASVGGEGEIDSGHPGPRPAGALRASKIASAILSNSQASVGGEGEIRTHGDIAITPVFKTGAFNRSATSPIPLKSNTCPIFCLTSNPISGVNISTLPH